MCCVVGAHWPDTSVAQEVRPITEPRADFVHSSLQEVTDTVFVLGDQFVIVDLDKQWMHLIRRHDSTISYPISSGNPRIDDGMHTPRGLYTVQTKNPLGISRQYDNARLWHWIGFNGNIGFHGLDGRGYYRYLGKKASSHGCLRMAREDIKVLYPLIPFGTPVLVSNERPVINLAFADSADNTQEYVVLDTLTTELQAEFKRIITMAHDGKKIRLGKRYAMSGSVRWRRKSLPIGVVQAPLGSQRFLNEF